MPNRRKVIATGGTALFLGLAGCSTTDSSSEPTASDSPRSTDSPTESATPTDTQTSNTDTDTETETETETEEPTPQKEEIDIGFPVSNLEVVEHRTWDEINRYFEGIRAVDSGVIYAGGTNSVGRVPYDSKSLMWKLRASHQSKFNFARGYISTGTGVHDLKSGDEIFSVNDDRFSTAFAGSNGPWYYDYNNRDLHKFDFEGNIVDGISATRYANSSEGLLDERDGLIYWPTVNGLYGFNIEKSGVDGSITEVEIGTGSEIDLVKDDLAGGRLRTTSGNGVYVSGGTAVSFDLSTHKKIAKFSVPTKPRYTGAESGKLITRNSGISGPFECYDLTSGEKLWSTGDIDVESSTNRQPKGYNGYFLAKLTNGRLRVYDIESGEAMTTLNVLSTGNNSLRGPLRDIFVHKNELIATNRFGFRRIKGDTTLTIESE